MKELSKIAVDQQFFTIIQGYYLVRHRNFLGQVSTVKKDSTRYTNVYELWRLLIDHV